MREARLKRQPWVLAVSPALGASRRSSQACRSCRPPSLDRGRAPSPSLDGTHTLHHGLTVFLLRPESPRRSIPVQCGPSTCQVQSFSRTDRKAPFPHLSDGEGPTGERPRDAGEAVREAPGAGEACRAPGRAPKRRPQPARTKSGGGSTGRAAAPRGEDTRPSCEGHRRFSTPNRCDGLYGWALHA